MAADCDGLVVYNHEQGGKKVNVRPARKAVDLAREIKELHEIDYPAEEKVVLVWDNLNTHVHASLYKAIEPK
ncbi:MAG: hypothetical protein HQL69_18585 [Magnetococcales bacterium]|nr:hypothetical protein [Magnetococcales bacterium]